MEIRLETVLGSAEIGLFALPTDRYVILSKEVNPSKVKVFEEVLDAEIIQTSLADSILISPFAAGNSNGIVLSKLVLGEEINKIKNKVPDLNVQKIDSKYTAVGNLVLCNDKGGIVSSLLGSSVAKTISDVLGVEVVSSTIAKRSYVGSLVAATNVGALVHVDADEDEIELVGGEARNKTVCDALISDIEEEVLINDKLGEELGIVIERMASGDWRLSTDSPEVRRRSEEPEYWS